LVWEGIFPPIITPFREDFEIDDDALRDLVHFLIKNGIHGIIPCGTAGEFPLMSLEEQRRVYKIVGEAVRWKIPLVAGTCALTTQDAVSQTRYAKEVGAEGVMVLPSFYYKHDEAELTAYYRAIAEVGLPIMVYNNPGHSQVDISPETIANLSEEIELVDYVKESSGDPTRVKEILRLAENRITVFAGKNDLSYESFVMGAKGWVAGVACIVPKECVEIFELTVKKKDFKSAKELYDRLLPLFTLLEQSGKYVQYVKAGVELIGLRAGPPREPLLPLSAKEKEKLKSCMREAEII